MSAKKSGVDVDRTDAERMEQMSRNCTWLVEQFDKVHDALCPSHCGTWQQRVEAAVVAAEKMGRMRSWLPSVTPVGPSMPKKSARKAKKL